MNNPTLSLVKTPFLAPAAGGGQAVTLEGSNLSGVSFVTVGAAQAVPTAKTNTSVTFNWPANLASVTPYDISVTSNPSAAFNILKQTTSNVLRRSVYYLPSSVKNAWYAGFGFSSTTTTSTWVDLVGGVAVSTFGGLARPVLRPDWSNGHPGVSFNGIAGLQNLTQPVQAQPGVAFVVGQTGATTAQTLMAGGTDANSWLIYQTGAGGTGTPSINAGSDLSETTTPLTSPCVVEGVFNGGTSSIQVNSVFATTGAAGAKNLTGITLGIHPDGVTDPLTNGYLGLVILCDGTFAVGDKAIIESIVTNLYAPVIATLTYTIDPVPPVTQTQLNTAVTAVDLQVQGIQDITGCTLLSDTTTNVGPHVQRVVVFSLTPQFQSNFTAPDFASPLSDTWASPFNSLYKHTLGAELGSVVTDSVVISQSF